MESGRRQVSGTNLVFATYPERDAGNSQNKSSSSRVGPREIVRRVERKEEEIYNEWMRGLSSFGLTEPETETDEESSSEEGPAALYIELILQNIFKFLGASDLKSCRLVCQKWRNLSLNMFRKKVAVVLRDTGSFVHNGYLGKSHKESKTTKNLMCAFDGKEIPFDSYYFYNEAWDWGNRINGQFLFVYGDSIRNFKADVRENSKKISVEEINSFRHILLSYMPNIEQLSLTISLSQLHPSTGFGYFGGEDEDPFPQDTLRNLKDVSIRIGSEGYRPLTFHQKQIVAFVFEDIIKRTTKLESLEINSCPAMIEMIQQLPKKNLKFLKHLTINDWKCQNMDSFNMFQALSQLSADNSIKLISLTADFEFANCEDNRVDLNISSFYGFLDWQKNNLQKLTIRLPEFIGNGSCLSDILNHDRILPPFPKMSKLTVLEARHGHKVLRRLFRGGEAWTNLVPQLKTFDCHFINYTTQEDNIDARIKRIKCASLTKMSLTILEDPLIGILSTSGYWRYFCQLYDVSKEIFPLLETFEITFINGEKVFSFSNQKEIRIPVDVEDDTSDSDEGDEVRLIRDTDYLESLFDFSNDDFVGEPPPSINGFLKSIRVEVVHEEDDEEVIYHRV